ncbi:hypothetical protein Tco_0047292 [Tanacetum coccineum]
MTIPQMNFPELEHDKANAYATTYKVPEKNKLQRKTYDIGSFIKWFCRRTGKKKLCKADLEGPAFNLVKVFHKNSVFLQYQMDECHKLLTNKVDLYNPEGDKERRIALSISKLKAARYLDFGLEELVPTLWVESELEYASVRSYGITPLVVLEERNSTSTNTNLFPRQYQEKFNHLSKTDKTSLHTQSTCDKKPVIRNRVGDLQLGIESYQTKINLERPNWDATDYYFKEDYTIIPKPRAVDTYPILLSFTHCGNKSILRVLRIILVILPEHPSETIVFHNEDGNPARANIKQALGYRKDGDGDGYSQPHKGVKASANSDVMYSFTSAQDGDPLQDDVRLCLGDDLKKAQDHSQRQAGDLP